MCVCARACACVRVCARACVLRKQVLEENEIGFDALELLTQKDIVGLGIKLGPGEIIR